MLMMLVCFILLCLNDVQPTLPPSSEVMSLMGPFYKYFAAYIPQDFSAYLLLFDFKVPSFVPVLFGIFTPFSFMASGLFTNHLVGEDGIKHRFETNQLQYSAMFIVNLLVLILSIVYWVNEIFNQYLFWVGFIGSLINIIGQVSLHQAMSKDNQGTVLAITGLSNILLVVIECLKLQKMLSLYELLGFLFGLFGTLILVIPDKMRAVIYRCKRTQR